MADLSAVDYQPQGDYNDADDKGWYAVAPDVHALVVHHEKTFQYLLRGVEIYPIPMCDMLVILHIPWSCVIVADCGPAFGLNQWLLLHLRLNFAFVLFCWHRVAPEITFKKI